MENQKKLENVLLDLYATGGAFLAVNKKMLSILGPSKTLFISNLVDKLNYHIKHNPKKVKDNWFFQTHEQQIKVIGAPEYTIRKCKKYFKEIGVLEIVQRGLPAKEWYHLNMDKLHTFIEENTLGNEITEPLESPKSSTLGSIESAMHKENKDNTSFKKDKRSLGSEEPDASKMKRGAPKPNSLLVYWNTLPNLQTHGNTTTKTYKGAVSLLRQLKTGTFFRRNAINKDFLKQHKIPEEYTTKKWTDEEIKVGMVALSKLATPGYGEWGNDKTTIPKGLPAMLFNPHTGSSLFMMVVKKPPKLIANGDPDEIVDYESLRLVGKPQIVFRKILTQFQTLTDTKNTSKKLIQSVEELIYFHSEILKRSSNIDYHIGPVGRPQKFCSAYVEWLKEENSDGFRITPKMIGPESARWDDFLKSLFSGIGLSFNLKTRKVSGV